MTIEVNSGIIFSKESNILQIEQEIVKLMNDKILFVALINKFPNNAEDIIWNEHKKTIDELNERVDILCLAREKLLNI